MKQALAVALVVAAATTPLSLASAGGKGGHQHVEGSITLAQPYPPDNTCFYRGQRTIMATSRSAPNGLVGYTFEVDPTTVGKRFKLEAGGADVGLDIVFYPGHAAPTDPTATYETKRYETTGPGGEKGVVPPKLPVAVICMTQGLNGSFTYAAGKGVK